jgi:tetratricopeptide (TPR) repeat protein
MAALALVGAAIGWASLTQPATARTGDKPAVAEKTATSQSLLGNYLAGRFARSISDGPAAAEFYARALERDPENPVLLANALQSETAEGEIERALPLAQKVIAIQPKHHLAELVLSVAAYKAGKLDEAATHIGSARTGPIAELVGNMALAWVQLAQGNPDSAMATLDGIRTSDGAMSYVRYHKGLLSDVAGKTAEARSAYERAFRDDPQSLRITLAFAHHLAKSGDIKQARATIDEHIRRSSGNVHPEVKALQERLRKNERVGLLIDKPIDGFAEVLFGIGEAMAGEGRADIGACYLQLALALKPQFPFALAALANVYETNKRYEDAISAYDRIPKGSPLHLAIEIRKAQNLNQLEKVDEAKALLEKLAAADRTDIRPLDALGALMRSHKRYGEAVDYYSRVLALIPKPEKQHWAYYYARGTSYERIKKWQQAEADLQRALKLSPDQPYVLNYLGYSWVDQGRNLREGLRLIERAVQLKPEDGYIVDSLGWARFRLGNFKEAVKYLERAVELKPEDPTLNDHLGDAYWRAGRELEAKFQWDQALTLKPEPDEADKIKRKIEAGGLPPLSQVRTGKRGKEPTRADTPRRRIESRATPTRPIVQ